MGDLRISSSFHKATWEGATKFKIAYRFDILSSENCHLENLTSKSKIGVCMTKLSYLKCTLMPLIAGKPPLKRHSGVAHPQGSLRPIAVFYPFGHPMPYTSAFTPPVAYHNFFPLVGVWALDRFPGSRCGTSGSITSSCNRNFPCQTLKIKKVSIIVMGS